VLGTAGVGQVLQALKEGGHAVRTVCIGGVNAANIPTVIYKSGARGRLLDGVAIVSAIMAAEDPERAAGELARLVRELPPFGRETAAAPAQSGSSVQGLLDAVPGLVRAMAETTPLSHNMTNLVSGQVMKLERGR
jgi:thiamine-phosphate diphosphorylase / hydroxyethylthiazole kinase